MSMRRFQHWIDAVSHTWSLIPEGDAAAHPTLFVGQPRLCCTIEAPSWNEAMRRYHDHMGWEPYRPMLRADGTPYPEDEGHDPPDQD